MELNANGERTNLTNAVLRQTPRSSAGTATCAWTNVRRRHGRLRSSRNAHPDGSGRVRRKAAVGGDEHGVVGGADLGESGHVRLLELDRHPVILPVGPSGEHLGEWNLAVRSERC